MQKAILMPIGLIVLLVLTFSFSIVLINAQNVGDSWSMFGHDLSHTMSSFSSAPRTNETLWIRSLNGPVRSSSALVNDILYTGIFNGYVYALHSRTGEVLWSYATADNIWSTPAVANGKVYVGSNDFSFYALDISTGNKVWSFATGGAVWSSPAVVGNIVYVGSADDTFYAFDANSGALIWNYTTGGDIRSSPAVANGIVYFGSQDGYFYALNASTGNKIWSSFTNEGDTYTNSSPAYADGIVYVGSTDNAVFAFDASSGAQVWKYTTFKKVSSSPAIYGGNIYIGCEDFLFYCLNSKTGQLVWSYNTGSPVYSSAAIADGIVYVASWGGKIFAFDAFSGNIIWNYQIDASIFAAPAIANGIMYVGAYDNRVYAFGEYDPTLISPMPSPSSSPTFKPTPSVPDDVIANLTTTIWTPDTPNAVVAPIAAAAGAAVASVAVAAVATPAGLPTDRIVKQAQNLLPSTVKSWLSSFIASKRKIKVEEKTGSIFKPTKTETLVYIFAIILLSLSFAYVKVDSLNQILIILPTILITSIFVGFAKTFISITYSRHQGVWTEYKLWYFGLVLFIFTTLLLRTPFSKPARSVSYSPKYTKKLGSTLSITSIFLSLAFAVFFLALILSGFTLIGSTGLAMCIIDAFFDTFPIKPMNGKIVYDYSKKIWVILFLITLGIYVAWLILG